MKNYNLMGIVIGDRKSFAPDVQEVFTRYGNIIKMRIGLHEDEEIENSNEGFIILSLDNDDSKIDALLNELNNVESVIAKNVKF